MQRNAVTTICRQLLQGSVAIGMPNPDTSMVSSRSGRYGDIAVVRVGAGVEVEVGKDPAVVDHRSVGLDGARGINREVGTVLQPKEPMESGPVEVNSADVATLVNCPQGGIRLFFEVKGGEPVSLRPCVAVDESVRIAVVANDLYSVVNRPTIGREEAGVVEDREATVVTQ